ncbi:MAG: CHASE2 domain-containing protein [Ignavibacteriales bacterium]|nr:CHASE2 domain-containing protein [Ignavibacteriales bacterium]
MAVDQPSLDVFEKEQGLGWPWPRQIYAPLLDFLKSGGAKAVFFDLMMTRGLDLRRRGRPAPGRGHDPLRERPAAHLPQPGREGVRSGRASAPRALGLEGRPAPPSGRRERRRDPSRCPSKSWPRRPRAGQRPVRSRRRLRLPAPAARLRNTTVCLIPSLPLTLAGFLDAGFDPADVAPGPLGRDDPPLLRAGEDLSNLFDRRDHQLPGPDRRGSRAPGRARGVLRQDRSRRGDGRRPATT